MIRTKMLFKRITRLSFLASVGVAALLSLAQTDVASAIGTAPLLGAADSFGVLGASTVTNTGPTIITGDLGLSPGTSITGFPPGTVIGTINTTDAVAAGAQADAEAAYLALAGQPCDFSYTAPTDLAGLTLVPGVHCFSSSVQISSGGILTLNAQGNNNAVWVFKIGSTLTTISGASVVFINGGQDCNVFWQVGSSATLGTTSKVVGTIIADQSITLNSGATVSGRVLALNGAVTLDSNVVSVCSLVPPPVVPMLGKGFNPASINEGGTSALTITLSNPNTSAATLSASLVDTLPSGVTTVGSPTTTCGGTSPTVTASTVTLPSGATIPAGSSSTPGTCTVTANVTASAGIYLNTLVIGALRTNLGNNPAPAIATLTVVPPPTPGTTIPPTLGKAFSPNTINAGGVSTLTITLFNPNTTPANFSAPLIDTLPTGVVIASTPNASSNCGGMTATAGGNTVTLSGSSIIPAGTSIAGTCTATVDVTAPLGGSFLNTIVAGALQTSNGNNAAPAIATLTVVSPPPPPSAVTAVPTLSEWGMIIFMVFGGLMSIYYLRRQRR